MQSSKGLLMPPRVLRDDLEAYIAKSNGTPFDWGPALWKLYHDSVRSIPCDHCREEGILMMEGLHDMVNVFKGEKPERPASLCALAQQSQAASKKAGTCPVKQFRFQ